MQALVPGTPLFLPQSKFLGDLKAVSSTDATVLLAFAVAEDAIWMDACWLTDRGLQARRLNVDLATQPLNLSTLLSD